MTMQLAGIDQENCPEVILHIGAGYGEDLPALLDLSATRIVLVEPNPDCLAELEMMARGDTRVELISAAVSAAETPPARAPLHVFNMQAHSSLRAPSPALATLFPALREIDAPMVDVLSLSALLDRLALPEDVSVLVLLDAPGESAALLAELVQSGRMLQFDQVLLHAGAEPLYESELPLSEALALVQDAGYRLVSRDNGDPDFPACVLRVDAVSRLGVALSEAQAEAAHQADRIAGLDTALSKTRSALDAAKTDVDTCTQALEAQFERAQSLEAQLVDCTKRENSLKTENGYLRKALGAAEKEATSQRLALDRTENRVQAVETKLKQCNTALAEAKAAHDTSLVEARAAHEALETDFVHVRGLAEEREMELAKQAETLRDQDESISALQSALEMVSTDLEDRLAASEARSAEREVARVALASAKAEADAALADLEDRLAASETRSAEREAARVALASAKADADAALADLEDRLAASEARSAEREAARVALASAKADADAALADLEDQLAVQKSRSETLQEGITRRDNWLRDHEASQKVASAQLTDREEALRQSEETCDTLKARLAGETAALEQARADARAQSEAAADKLTNAEDNITRRDTWLKDIKARLERKETDLGVALRSQAAAQADLLELRGRFETLRQEKDALDGLLIQVTTRLSAASDYLHMLNGPQNTPRRLADQDTPAKPAVPKAPKKRRKPRRGA
ncbi:hypothetical protein KO516_22185 [Citreicella sp. C3M06]|uniref:hypothetical protein n=1 Tax=Citreicella sp. C3M06 TaxID=2841564 RepID=UPI001C09A487|nr:hypothetical protein [Citreicella sp. C3M06]MBU2963486.1 hypothetical protein [Citreicella sp. C3M06]